MSMIAARRSNFHLYLCGLFCLFLSACRAVKINSVTVPSLHELREDSGPLILDCDFSVENEETGFVLKWLHNSVAIYQWIPSKKVPFALGAFKGRVDLNYTSSDDRLKKHSALVITKPLPRDSGRYTCNVASFQSSDKQSADMLIIDPADSIDLTYTIDQVKETVSVKCEVHNIYPLPDVKLLFDSEEKDVPTDVETKLGDESYNVTVSAILLKNKIQDESPVSCLVKIPNSEYEKKETITYDDPKQSATTKKYTVGELTKFDHSDADSTNENCGLGVTNSISVLLASVLLTIFFTVQ